MKNRLISLTLSVAATVAVVGLIASSSSLANTTAAQLDKMTPEQLAVEARKEGKVVVYSFTSRISRVEQAFEAAYPGIDLVAVDINSTQQIARIKAEQQARNYQADVAYISDAPVVFGDLVAKGLLQRYIPPSMANKLAPQYQTPLLSQRLSTKVLMYNAENHPNGAPVKNLWELTQPQWKGRVVMVDPTLRGDYLDFLTEVALRAPEMAKAYQALTGQALPSNVNAGEKWIKDLYNNGLVLVRNTDAVNDAIGKKSQQNAPIGISTYSDVRDNKSLNRALALANDVMPSPGIVFPAYLGLVKNTTRPAAARLLITFMMGDSSPTGGPAFAPFYVPGDYATRSDIKPHPDAIVLSDFRAWRMNPTKTFAARQKIGDLLLTLR
jgi:iron(III) transport system substrate-binding protein